MGRVHGYHQPKITGLMLTSRTPIRMAAKAIPAGTGKPGNRMLSQVWMTIRSQHARYARRQVTSVSSHGVELARCRPRAQLKRSTPAIDATAKTTKLAATRKAQNSILAAKICQRGIGSA